MATELTVPMALGSNGCPDESVADRRASHWL
jgi:hypothetical protein